MAVGPAANGSRMNRGSSNVREQPTFPRMNAEMASTMANDNGRKLHELPWLYLDSVGQEYGPVPGCTMREWLTMGRFPVGGDLRVRLPEWERHLPLHKLFPDLSTAFVLPPAWPDIYSDGVLQEDERGLSRYLRSSGGCGQRIPLGASSCFGPQPAAMPPRMNERLEVIPGAVPGMCNRPAGVPGNMGLYPGVTPGGVPAVSSRVPAPPSQFGSRVIPVSDLAGIMHRSDHTVPATAPGPPSAGSREAPSDGSTRGNSLLPPPPPQPSRQQLREILSQHPQ